MKEVVYILAFVGAFVVVYTTASILEHLLWKWKTRR